MQPQLIISKRRREQFGDELDGLHHMTYALAEEIQVRVFRRGEPVDPVTPYDKKQRKLVSPRYPVGASATATQGFESGVLVYKHSADFHDALGVRDGTFDVAGGMRDGTAVHVQPEEGRMAFRGRSEGQDPNFRKYASGKWKARGKKVSNALKAATVLKSKGVNVLKPTQVEAESLLGAMGQLGQQLFDSTMPVDIDWGTVTGHGDPRLVRKLADAALQRRTHA